MFGCFVLFQIGSCGCRMRAHVTRIPDPLVLRVLVPPQVSQSSGNVVTFIARMPNPAMLDRLVYPQIRQSGGGVFTLIAGVPHLFMLGLSGMETFEL